MVTVFLGGTEQELESRRRPGHDPFEWTLVEPDNVYVRRMVWQYEVAPSTKQVHVQLYLELTQPRTFAWVKQHLVGERAHVEARRGSARQCYEYCKKEESRLANSVPHEIGDWSDLHGQGRRSDLTAFSNDVRQAKSFSEFMNDPTAVEKYASSMLRYMRHAREIWNVSHLSQKRMLKWTDVNYVWICGPPGVGKTYSIYAEYGLEAVYEKNPDNKWWDGYAGHPVILINDYRGSVHLPYQALLNIADVYPYQGEVKGNVVHIQPSTKVIVVTSNKWPWEIWPVGEIDPRQQDPQADFATPLCRRFILLDMDYQGTFTEIPRRLPANWGVPPPTPSTLASRSLTPMSLPPIDTVPPTPQPVSSPPVSRNNRATTLPPSPWALSPDLTPPLETQIVWHSPSPSLASTLPPSAVSPHVEVIDLTQSDEEFVNVGDWDDIPSPTRSQLLILDGEEEDDFEH